MRVVCVLLHVAYLCLCKGNKPEGYESIGGSVFFRCKNNA